MNHTESFARLLEITTASLGVVPRCRVEERMQERWQQLQDSPAPARQISGPGLPIVSIVVPVFV